MHLLPQGIELLRKKADPNLSDPYCGYTPLHLAIYGYHSDRIDETCKFIDELLEHGASPHFTNKSGETAPHLVIGTNDFRVNVGHFSFHLLHRIFSTFRILYSLPTFIFIRLLTILYLLNDMFSKLAFFLANTLRCMMEKMENSELELCRVDENG